MDIAVISKVLAVVIYLILSAERLPAQEPPQRSHNICSYYGETIDNLPVMFASAGEAEQIIARIINVIGLKPRFEIRAAKIPNAAAVILQNKRFVLYNPDFVSALNKQAGNSWASVSILAHEIGHHLNGHTLDEGGSRPDLELEADEFSGFVLRKMGASLADAQSAMRIAASVKASHTHPAKNDRLSAIQRGWNNAGDHAKENVPPAEIKKPVVSESPKTSSEVLAEKYIAMDVSFHADPGGNYYITIRNNLVKVQGGKLFLIGRFAQSNRKGYSYMIYDDHYNYLYVDSKGRIYNAGGKHVGRLKKHATG
jgi:hypothetical protein